MPFVTPWDNFENNLLNIISSLQILKYVNPIIKQLNVLLVSKFPHVIDFPYLSSNFLLNKQ